MDLGLGNRRVIAGVEPLLGAGLVGCAATAAFGLDCDERVGEGVLLDETYVFDHLSMSSLTLLP